MPSTPISRTVSRSLATALLMVAVRPGTAAELQVSNLNDSGAGSLRAALLALPTNEHNRIVISAPFGTLQLQSGLPPLRGLSVEVVGNFQIIDGGGQHSIFVGNLPTTLRRLSLRAGSRSTGGCASLVGSSLFDQVGFENCRAGIGGSNAYGGGADVFGDLVVRASAFRNNLAEATLGNGNGQGGGLSHAGGALSIQDSLFESNTVAPGPSIFALGGAVVSSGSSVQLFRSRFIGNRARGSEGSGAAVLCSAPLCRIEASYFGANISEGSAGALFAQNAAVFIENTSFHANESRFGGALYLVNSGAAGSASLRLRASSFRLNQSTNTGFGRQGGHLAINGAARIDEFSNVALAEVAAGTGCLFLGTPPSYAGPGYNRSADSSCNPLLGSDSLQVTPAEIALGAPVFSGFVETLRPAPGSVLINAGNPAPTGPDIGACPSTDADGRPRPRPASFGAPNRCDIGAVEIDIDLFRDGFETP